MAATEGRVEHILSDLDEFDFELVDPPAGIWESIETSVGAREAKQAPSRRAVSPMVVEYAIDAEDRVIDVGDGWGDFARDNGAAEIASPDADRALWSYMDQAEIRELWQLVVARVRSEQREANLPFRCDAPHTRRWFDMTVTPAPDGGVRFRSTLVFEEDRSTVALLDPDTERDAAAEPVALCSWCGRGEHDARWLAIEELVQAARLLEQEALPPISYGICGGCREEMSAELLVPAQAGEA